MVTSVSNNSANILALFQTGKDTGAANNEDTLAKIQKLAKEAEQMKAGASPAQMQGASVAADAWISASDTAQQATSATTETTSTSERPISKWPAITDPEQLARVIQEYNGSVRGSARVKAQLEESKALLAAATDENEFDHFSKLVELNTYIVAKAEEKIAEYPDRIENAARQMNEKWDVTGNLIVRKDDGTYALGKFDARLKDSGFSLYYSNSSGSVWHNQQMMVSGPDLWAQVVSQNEDGIKIILPS